MKYKMSIIVLTASLASTLVIGCGGYQATSARESSESYSSAVQNDSLAQSNSNVQINDTKDSIYSIDGTFSNIDILTDIADITVQKGSPAQVEVHLSDQYRFDLEIKEDTLYLTEKQNISWWRHFINFSFGSSENSIIVTLAQDQWDEFITASDTGSIYIKDQNADTFTIDSDTGSIKLENCQAADIHTDNDTGNIEVNNCQATTIRTTNDTGATDLHNVSANVSSESDTGKINISNGNLTDLKAESDTGAIAVTQTSVYNIDLKTDTGKIELEVGGEKNDYNYDFNFDTGHIKLAQDKYSSGTYQLNNNATKNMTLRSSTGSCSIQFFQPDDQ